MEIKITDPIWGKFTINEPILIKLINSKPVQRLKNISQSGAAKYIFPWKTITRFDHSLGVMLLLKRFNASLDEQIAGLLHDVPHTAFSHVIDFVFPSNDHEYHEKFHEKIILSSEIPQILKNHQLDIDKILSKHDYSLLEQKLPDLCADRIDYFLRDEYSQFGINQLICDSIKYLQVKKGRFYFNDPKTALLFAKGYLNRDETTWSDPAEIASFQVLAEAIKEGLKSKYLTENDLFSDDHKLFSKLQRSNNLAIKKYISFLRPGFKIKLDTADYDYFLKNKLRYIDPQVVLANEEVKKVTEIFPEFKNVLANHKRKMIKGFYIKIQ